MGKSVVWNRIWCKGKKKKNLRETPALTTFLKSIIFTSPEILRLSASVELWSCDRGALGHKSLAGLMANPGSGYFVAAEEESIWVVKTSSSRPASSRLNTGRERTQQRKTRTITVTVLLSAVPQSNYRTLPYPNSYQIGLHLPRPRRRQCRQQMNHHNNYDR